MVIGIVAAVIAGVMLGLYALPGKYVKDFQEENKWSLFFLLTMFVVPLLTTFALMKGVGEIYAGLETGVLIGMVVSSLFWGVGVMMWGKAIDYIGLSLGFSLFIGTVLLVGTCIPLFVGGMPPAEIAKLIFTGLGLILLGVFLNGSAGIVREKDEAKLATETKDDEGSKPRKSATTGIAIAIIGGLLATGFAYANTVGALPLGELSQAQGNAPWMTALAVMLPIFLSGGVIMTGYFGWQLTQKKAWGSFRTPSFGTNTLLIFVMAFFHYAASAIFAYAASMLGEGGDAIGYAIFNTACVVTAIISGLMVGEWKKASGKAKMLLYGSLLCMVGGVLVLAYSKTIKVDAPMTEAVAEVATAIETFRSCGIEGVNADVDFDPSFDRRGA
jgi:hypothetical protein